MSAIEIKKLMSKFDYAYDAYDYYEMRSHDKSLNADDREEYESLAEAYEYDLYDIAEKIKKLAPSKYMRKKYPEIEFMLSYT